MKLANSLQKLGTENAFVVLAKAKALEAQGKEIINLGIGQPDFRTPKHIVDKPTMFFAMLMFGQPGTEIIYPEPGFPIYESMINYSGAKAVPMYLSEKNNFSFKAEEVLKLINDKTRLIIINNPQNPTGGLIEREQIDKLVVGLKKFPEVAILSDEIYSRQIYDNKKMPSFFNYPELFDRLIVLDGWSKTYAMTGWRLGWSVESI